MKIGIVGAGRAGLSIAQLLRDSGHEVGIYARSVGVYAQSVGVYAQSGSDFSQVTSQSKAYWPLNSLNEALEYGSWLILAVPDSEIAGVWAQVKSLANPPTLRGVIHLSGAQGTSIFDPLPDGLVACALHPIRAFNQPTSSLQEWDHTYIGFSGPIDVFNLWKANLPIIEERMIYIEEGQRVLYHSAAVMASNYTLPLLLASLSAYTQAGLSHGQAVDVMRQLIMSVLHNLEQMDPGLPGNYASGKSLNKVLTGPLIRGDMATIESHIKAWAHQPGYEIYLEGLVTTLNLLTGGNWRKEEETYGWLHKYIL